MPNLGLISYILSICTNCARTHEALEAQVNILKNSTSIEYDRTAFLTKADLQSRSLIFSVSTLEANLMPFENEHIFALKLR